MPGCINQIQKISLAITGFIVQRGGLRLNRDAALFFDVHAVQNLRTHFAVFQAAAVLDEAVGEGGFAVVDVGDDGEIADIFHLVRYGFGGRLKTGFQSNRFFQTAFENRKGK